MLDAAAWMGKSHARGLVFRHSQEAGESRFRDAARPENEARRGGGSRQAMDRGRGLQPHQTRQRPLVFLAEGRGFANSMRDVSCPQPRRFRGAGKRREGAGFCRGDGL